MRISAMPRDRLARELKGTLILGDLSPRELRRFGAACELREYDPGELIVEEGTLGTDLVLLLTGSIAIRLKGKDGAEVAVAAIEKGDVLGEASIFTSLPRTASAFAQSASLVAAISREALFSYCDRNPRAGLKIFTFVIYSLLSRLGATSRDLLAEREAVVTREDLERLRSDFPKSLEDMLGA